MNEPLPGNHVSQVNAKIIASMTGARNSTHAGRHNIRSGAPASELLFWGAILFVAFILTVSLLAG